MDLNRLKFWNRKSRPDDNIRGPRRSFFRGGSQMVNEETSMKVAAYYRGVTYISTQVAKLPWDVKDKANDIIENDLSNLLNLAPNPEMNAFTFRLLMIQNAIHFGNAFAEIERRYDGRAIALWPLNTRDVEVTRAPNGELVYKISNQQGPDVYLRPKDVFHLKNFHTRDGLIGQGLVAFASETIGITLAADIMASGIFNNGGVPSGVLTVTGALSDEAFNRLKEDWEAQNGGRKTGGTTILEEGMKYESIKVEPDTLQFLESRQFGVLELCRFFGLPPTKLFDTAASTYSNVEQANLEVATDTLDAWVVNLEMEADVKILNNRYGGLYTELDLYAVFRGDMKSRSDYYKSMYGIGAYTSNQIRRREGLPGYGTKGDKYYISSNNFTPVDRLDEVIDSQIKAKETPAAPAKDVSPQDDDENLDKAAARFLLRK